VDEGLFPPLVLQLIDSSTNLGAWFCQRFSTDRECEEGSQMVNERVPSHGVMEGEGSYNRHATLPADGAALALPLLEKAIKGVELDSGDEPIVIADYGSSQEETP